MYVPLSDDDTVVPEPSLIPKVIHRTLSDHCTW